MRDVITWAVMQRQVDSSRIGLWGTSYSGGHVLVVAATDRRVRCVVSQVPTVSGYKNTLRATPTDKLDAILDAMNEDRIDRAKGLPPKLVAISVEGSESYEWSAVAGVGTTYVNSVTLRTLDLRMAYEPGIYIPRIAPTPLLIILLISLVAKPYLHSRSVPMIYTMTVVFSMFEPLGLWANPGSVTASINTAATMTATKYFLIIPPVSAECLSVISRLLLHIL